MTKPLIKSLIDAGYKISKITQCTEDHGGEIEINGSVSIGYDDGLMDVMKKLPSGNYYSYGVTTSVNEILNDIEKALG